jgi:hypothetical protein
MFVKSGPADFITDSKSLDNWTTAESDRIIRCYWMCVILERSFFSATYIAEDI